MIPKTATASMAEFLFSTGEWDLLREAHTMAIPPGYEDYKTITMVRNPYARMVSMWKWYSTHPTKKTIVGKMKLEQFIQFCIAKGPDGINGPGGKFPWLFGCQVNFLNQRPNIVLRLEGLPDCLKHIPGISLTKRLLKHRHRLQSKHYTTYYNGRSAKLLLKHSEKDFIVFKYDWRLR